MKKILPYLGAPASGLLLVAGFPHFNLYFLTWAALVPLMLSMRERSFAWRCAQGYIFGVFFLGALFHWVTLVRYPAALGYLLFLIILPLMFIPWAALTGWALDDNRPAVALLLPAAGWAALELAASQGAFASPWWSLAVSQAANPPAAQIASWAGMYGISFFAVAANVFIYCAGAGKLKASRNVWITAGAAFAIALSSGAWSAFKTDWNGGKAVKVSLIQANFSQEVKDDALKRGVDIAEMHKAYWEISARAAKKYKPSLIVWSESALPVEMLTETYYRPFTQEKLSGFGATLLTGVYEGDHNSVVAIDPRRGLTGKYDKVHLVPFGEFVPYRKQLGFTPGLKKWIDEKIYTEDLSPGAGFRAINTSQGKLGAMVCFESMLPAIARRLALEGSDMLFVVTNDAWFLRSPAAEQHIALARLRAIENRRWLAQAANTGISVIIDPSGKIIKQSSLFKREIINGVMRSNSDLSFYTRYGNLFTFLCALYLAAGIPYVWLQSRPAAKTGKGRKLKAGNKK